MSSRRTFRQADATRALRAAVSAGLKPSGYRIDPDGSIHVDLVGDTQASNNSFDALMRAR
jgi:hypothetical protein